MREMAKFSYVVDGTCDGYNTNFLKSSKDVDKSKFDLIDVNKGSNPNTKGKSCYSISLQKGIYILSKIQIIRDGKRSKSIGFVKFNLIIPIGIKLNTNIINLLDEGLGIYTDEYVDSNYVLNDENKQNSKFDEKIEDIISKVQIQNVTKYNWSVGQSNPAYIYVNKTDLLSYFEYDKIFQPEYAKHHEIYFIDESDRGDDSILQALKHEENANLTNKVSLEKLSNPPYQIKFAKKDEKIEYSGPMDGQQVKINDPINLSFTKKNYETDNRGVYNGNLNDLLNKYPAIFKKSTTEPYTIEIHEPHFKPVMKVVQLIFKNREGKEIDLRNLNIKISQERNKQVGNIKFSNGKFKLEGNNIELAYSVKVESEKFNTFRGSYYYKDLQTIVLEKKNEKKALPFKQIALIALISSVLLLVCFKLFVRSDVDVIVDYPSPIPGPEDNKIDTIKICTYLEGDSLLLSSLNEYKKNENLPNTIKVKLDSTIFVREAIESKDFERTNIAWKIKGLPDQQNDILELIYYTFKDNKEGYKIFCNTIENMSDITIKQLEEKIKDYKIDSEPVKIEDPKTQQVNDPKKDEKKTNTDTKNPPVTKVPNGPKFYSEGVFYTNLKAGSLDDTKMTPEMKNVRSLWDETSKAKRNTIEFKNLVEFKLSLKSLK